MNQSTNVLLVILCLLGTPFLSADEPAEIDSNRFQQASERTFKAFDPQTEQTWDKPFFFMQLADPQYGMFTGNEGLDQEKALIGQAVEHINRLQPRFVIVCGDLTNAPPTKPATRLKSASTSKTFQRSIPRSHWFACAETMTSEIAPPQRPLLATTNISATTTFRFGSVAFSTSCSIQAC
tara:strand:+ start:23895 stop:24434 length:540 start_codon:yes stop_codon:yes gene_type:complete